MSTRESDAAHNRAHLPQTLGFVDELREAFGDDQVKPIYLYEAGYEAGHQPYLREEGTSCGGALRVMTHYGTRRIGPRAQPGTPHEQER
ncbi:MAG: hypothetical protein ACLFSR_03770 [Halomonas sp.]